MTDTISRLRIIRQRHLFYNRLLTVSLMAIVCALGGALSWFDVTLSANYKVLAGLAIMLFAVLLYKIPYFAYRLNRAWFVGDEESLRLMGTNWRLYKLRILNFGQVL